MRKIALCIWLLYLAGCSEIIPEPYEPSSGHINTQTTVDQSGIPELVQQTPVLPEPEPPVELEKYTVVVNGVPVNELLFALARDAKINVDIDPSIQGVVTLNAVDQTLPQLLKRISRQVNIRYEFDKDNLIISPDNPYFRTYKVDYLNIARDTSNSVTISTQIASTSGGGDTTSGGGGGGNNSTTEVTSEAKNHFWGNLVQNVRAIIGEDTGTGAGGGTDISVSKNVIPHPESGILTVNATSRQHEQIQRLIDTAVTNAGRQVLIQATIIEVSLNDKFQSGIDWSFINQNGKAGFDFKSTTQQSSPVGALSSFLINYVDPSVNRDQIISASLKLLEEFGKVTVLSSPQIMALNNQTAILKVVDNVVYFEVQADISQNQTQSLSTVDTTAKTVPVGIVMSLTPQINENDSIILQVRPTISRINAFVEDPAIPLIAALNPNVNLSALTAAASNQVPEIQVREMESVLRMNNGQIAVLGGLMVDESTNSNAAIPGVSRIPLAGEAFKSRTRDFSKKELVIFLRPVVVRTPSIENDLRLYKSFLENNAQSKPEYEGKLK